jgi:hypothetical protein
MTSFKLKTLFSWLFLTLLASGLTFASVRLIQSAVTRPIWFEITGDEATHSELIAVLAQEGRYGSWSGYSYASTGPAVIIPAAAISKAIGIAPSSAGRLTTLIYLLVLILSLRTILRITWVLAILGGLSTFSYFTFGVFGELPGVFFLLMTGMQAQRKSWVAVGVFTGLAVLSKPFFGLLVPVAILFPFLDQTKKDRWASITKSLKVCAGGILSLTAWILVLVAGWGVRGTRDYFVEFVSFLHRVTTVEPTAGVAPDHFTELLDSVVRHSVGIVTILSPWSIVGCLVAIAWGVRHTRDRPDLRLWFQFGSIHFLWWFVLSPWAEPRYLLPSVAAFAFLGAAMVSQFWTQSALHPRILQRLIWVPAVIIALSFSFRMTKELNSLVDRYSDLPHVRQKQAQKFFKSVAQEGVPLQVWSTSSLPELDLAYVLAFPYRILPLKDIEEVDGWVTVGQHAKREWLDVLRNRCDRRLALGDDQGVYLCKKIVR